MSDIEIQLLGVKHPDERIHQEIDNVAAQDGGPDVVYHEMPDSTTGFAEFSVWMILKNPAGIVPAILYVIKSMLKMRRGVSVSSSGTAHIKSECRVAAERLREDYDADLVNIGMNRLDLLKRRSWRSAAASWGIILVALWIILKSIQLGALGGLWFLIFPFALSLRHRTRTLDNIRELRDEHLASNINKDIDGQGRATPIVIVGQKHVEGIGSHLSVYGYSTVCRWLSREADHRAST